MIQPLSTKQTGFINAYIASNDAKQAALAAGYSAKSVAVEVCRLLKNPRIVAELARVKDLPPVPPGEVLDTGDQSPMAYLLAIMRDERAEPARRMQSAAKLLPYMHAKPGGTGKKAEQQAAASTAATGKFAVPSAPRLAVVTKLRDKEN